MEPYQRWAQPLPRIRLGSRTETASYGAWLRGVRSWYRCETYRLAWMHQPDWFAAEQMGLCVRTIERYRARILNGRHVLPPPFEPGIYVNRDRPLSQPVP